MLTGHEVIIKRNLYYRSFYRVNILIMIALIIGLVINTHIHSVFSQEKARPEYFLTDKTGKIIKDVPVSNPMYPNDQVEQWTQESLEQILNINYVNFARDLKRSSVLFTPLGHRQYLSTLVQSKNIEAIKAKKYTVVSEFVEPMKVARRIQSGGRALWLLEGKVRLYYLNSENIVSSSPMFQDLNLSVVVTRQSFYLYDNGIAIAIIIGT